MTRDGSTLIEMIVTLTVMAIVATVVTLAAHPNVPRGEAEYQAILADASRRALRLREPVTVTVTIDGRGATATFFPDGSAVGDTALALDRITGSVGHAP